MEINEHQDREEETGMNVPPGYNSLANSALRSRGGVTGSGEGGSGGGGSLSTGRKIRVNVRYRECLKNHAVGIGGHALDGCCEFMAAGEEGTLDALKCAACNCHRNFHRKEIEGGDGSGAITLHTPPPQHHHHHQFPPYYRAPPPPSSAAGYLHLTSPMPLELPSASGGVGYSRDEEDVSNPSSSGGGGSGGSKKRFRTKFTAEQKDKMLGFAEKLGWRIQKHDESAVEEFCAETGVQRNVLKVWMHNNKNTVGKKT